MLGRAPVPLGAVVKTFGYWGAPIDVGVKL
jgi:hypothetical protein